jgi:hypothetical protein
MPVPYLLPKLDHHLLVPNRKELADELSALRKQQFEALQNATFILMSTKESQEYEDRGARIRGPTAAAENDQRALRRRHRRRRQSRPCP